MRIHGGDAEILLRVGYWAALPTMLVSTDFTLEKMSKTADWLGVDWLKNTDLKDSETPVNQRWDESWSQGFMAPCQHSSVTTKKLTIPATKSIYSVRSQFQLQQRIWLTRNRFEQTLQIKELVNTVCYQWQFKTINSFCSTCLRRFSRRGCTLGEDKHEFNCGLTAKC